MQSLSRVAAVVFLIGSLSCPVQAGAPKKPIKADFSRDAVEKVLRAEVAGPVDRRAQLAAVLETHPDSGAAQWQAGFVRDAGAWQEFDHPRKPANSESVEQYLSRRESAQPTVAGQLELADWCLKHDLPDQARAHLTAALAVASPLEQPTIFPRLGYVKIGNRWIHGQQLLQWREMNRRAEAAIKRWAPKLEKITEKLEGSPKQHALGVTSLRELSGADVIPAVEFVLCGRNEIAANAASDMFARMDDYEATTALCKQAVFSNWPEVRRQATQSLKSRRLEDFVPPLIGLLASPYNTGFSAELIYWQDRPYVPFTCANARLTLLTSFVIARETSSQFELAVLKSVDYRLNDLFAGVSLDHGGLSFIPHSSGPNTLLNRLDRSLRATDNDRTSAVEARQLQDQFDAMNERTEELNSQVIAALAAVTGRPPNPDPRVWWKWSDEFTDTQQLGPKPVVTVAEDDIVLGNPTQTMKRCSCFVAGTPVWTNRGPQAINKIVVGDLVLSKDIETGELAYKPVLQTTVRPPKELTTLRFGDELIVCTGGHRFWGSGTGWIKARDLTEQTLLHTVTSNTPVWTAKKGETAETYNLVVADFHTYFVGKTGVLCQDLLPPQRTNNVVPGLSRTNAVAHAKK